MMFAFPLIVMALSMALAAPVDEVSAFAEPDYNLEYGNDLQEQIIVPRKRAALVLDRLLIALQKALHDENSNQRMEMDRDGPRTAPLRLATFDPNDMTGLQRRGQGSGRGRVLRCYFNAITCF